MIVDFIYIYEDSSPELITQHADVVPISSQPESNGLEHH